MPVDQISGDQKSQDRRINRSYLYDRSPSATHTAQYINALFPKGQFGYV